MANLLDRVTVDPEICGGRPCIRGMRVRVKDVLADFPYLQDEDITAALEFASRATDHPIMVAVEP
jgi:uncharacterized protein (DUF433 family)